MSLPPSFVPKLARKARLQFDRHSGKHLLLYPERGLELNDSGAAIAKKCDGSRSIETIVRELSEEFAADDAMRAALAHDVEAFVVDLQARGLLQG